MRLHLRGILTVFTVLIVVRTLTHAVSAPRNVTVRCDSYSVEVEWRTDAPSKRAEFLLELIPDFGKSTLVRTKDLKYNISKLLWDTAYNRYNVKVSAREGDQESDFVKSKIFSFNFRKQPEILCSLEIPAVSLLARDRKLFVEFTNPMHLYRDTPALRNLSKAEKLLYTLESNSKTSKERLELFYECPFQSETCKSNVSFPEEQEEYCITLSGRIRQTRVWGKKPSCKLKPGPPVLKYTMMALGSLAGCFTLALITVFLVKQVSKSIKKKSLSKLPAFLENKLTHTPLITPLKTEPEAVAKNPRVEPAVKIPPDSTFFLQENATQSESPVITSSVSVTCSTKDKDTFSDFSQDNWNKYGYGAELSCSDLSTGYDRPHVQ